MNIPFILSGLLFSGICYYKRKQIKKNYEDWQELKKLVSSTEKNWFRINIVSLKIIGKMYYNSFRKRFFLHKPNTIDKNTFQIDYHLNDKSYKIIIKNKKGPTPILQVLNTDNQDITEKILEYAGPQYNFHGYKFTPKFWNYQKLVFVLSTGEEKTFTENEFIDLNI